MSSMPPNNLFVDVLFGLVFEFTVGNSKELLICVRVDNFSPSDLLMRSVKLGIVNEDEDGTSFVIFTGCWVMISGDGVRLLCLCMDLVSWSVKFFIGLMVSYLLGWSEP